MTAPGIACDDVEAAADILTTVRGARVVHGLILDAMELPDRPHRDLLYAGLALATLLRLAEAQAVAVVGTEAD